MRLDEYSAYDALGLAELVRAGEVTSAELVGLAIQSAELLNPTLRAVVRTYPERIESAPATPAGVFAGVPTLVKDLFHGEVGWECANGSRLCEGWHVAYADEFTERLHRAGLVPMGRSATSEFGILGTTETIAVGRTCSPWDTGSRPPRAESSASRPAAGGSPGDPVSGSRCWAGPRTSS